ncbi:hypothetical protein SAMN05216295_11287 [Pseudomonas luteola]|nr:hypothetical protein SAMN05216295_11287 [Pseudomonas zeshuii]
MQWCSKNRGWSRSHRSSVVRLSSTKPNNRITRYPGSDQMALCFSRDVDIAAEAGYRPAAPTDNFFYHNPST